VENTEDGWGVKFTTNAKKSNDRTGGEKATFIAILVAKICVIILSLYAFICSLSFLADGFRLVAGRQAGEIFRNSEVFNNPIAGMLVGVLVTVLVQSSSTSTSIVITMVAADLFTVKQAIWLVMGANIGTSVTSTIVALAQSLDKNEFRRAFAAATVHDMFNFCSVLVLLPIEAATGYLYRFSGALLPDGLESGEKPPDILKKLTKPFTKAILSIDKNVIKNIAAAETQEELDELADARIFKKLFGLGKDDLSDGAAGAIVLIGAITILCVTLFLVVYTLKSLLKGRIAVWLHKSVNGDIPDIKCGGLTIPMGWLSGYLAMGTGLLVTIAVQSSSITTSALTPLVGVGVINIERRYPTVLGANIGTCITGVLAALAADGSKLYLTLQVALSHLLFNITGIIIWYVIWPLRAVPVRAAKFLGNTTADYHWFALAYLIFCFFLIPALFMGLSLASYAGCVIVAVILVLMLLFVIGVNTLQHRKPESLPEKLRTWDFLPVWMTSLAPFDRVVCGPLDKICCAWWAKKQAKKATKTAPNDRIPV
jgi:sodium-dependent phosphate cotransporter